MMQTECLIPPDLGVDPLRGGASVNDQDINEIIAQHLNRGPHLIPVDHLEYVIDFGELNLVFDFGLN